MGVDSQLILMSQNRVAENDTNQSILTNAIYLGDSFQKAAYAFNVRQVRRALFSYNITPDTDNDINATLRYALKCVDYQKPYAVTLDNGMNNTFAIAPLYLLDISTEIQRDFIRDAFLFIEKGGLHTMMACGVPYPEEPTLRHLYALTSLLRDAGLQDYTQKMSGLNGANPLEIRSLNCRVGESISHFLVDTDILNEEQNTKFLKKHAIASVHFSATDLGITFLNYVCENPLSYQPYINFFNPYDTVSFSDVLDSELNSNAQSILKKYQTNGFTPSKRVRC